MRTATFIIETGKVDSNGDVIILDGLKIPDKSLPILKDFNHAECIGRATLKHEGGAIKADAVFSEKYFDGYPAIGFQVIKSEPNEHGGRNILEAKLHYVGISLTPNVDPSIKRLSEQLP